MVRRILVTSSSDKRQTAQTRIYARSECVVFRKTKEKFGGLSNMAAGFPLEVNGFRILTSEALYQACRFPHLPKAQQLIIGQVSPMTAKMQSKPYHSKTRPDWYQVRVKIMRWCLRVKLAQNWSRFSELLLQTGDRPIVEESHKDDFWGAKAIDERTLVGTNALGRLLMELRESLKTADQESLTCVEPLQIPDFLLNNKPIPVVFVPWTGTDMAVPTEIQMDAPASPRLTESKQMDIFKQKEFMEVEGEDQRGLIKGLKPYPEYKDSGLPWLGKRPAHWSQRRMKFLFRERVQKGFPGEPLLAATQTKGVVRKEDYGERTVTAQKDFHLLKLVEPGDFVISLRSFQGGIEVAHCRGIISPAYTILAPKRESRRAYFTHFFKSPDFIRSLTLFVTGIREGQNIDYARLSRAYLPLPPEDEQEAIGSFLNHANGRIEQAIKAKKKLIALLNEQKQAIIHRAVTRGLDPNVRLKPSGVAWLGDVPAHWSLTPNRSLLRIRKVLVGSRHTKYQLLSLTKVGVIVRDLTTGKGKFSNFWERSQEVRPGDLVFCLFDVDETPRTVGLSRHLGMISSDYTVMECSDRLTATFVECFYKTMDDRKLLSPLYTGLRKRISKPLLLAAKTPMPPPNEQVAIVRFIDNTVSKIEHSIGHLRREISLLTEYRIRLTADVVTGKLDVREAVAKLPEPVTESEDMTIEDGPDEETEELSELEESNA
jgi:type I restriction enzyme S subunit